MFSAPDLGWVYSPLPALPDDVCACIKGKFARFDSAGDGSLTDSDLAEGFSTEQERFPGVAARCLIRLFSKEGRLTFQGFLYLDRFTLAVLNVFQHNALDDCLAPGAAVRALRALGVGFSEGALSALLKSPLVTPGPSGAVSFVSFLSATSYAVLSQTRFLRWSQGGQTLELTAEKLLFAMLWFL